MPNVLELFKYNDRCALFEGSVFYQGLDKEIDPNSPRN